MKNLRLLVAGVGDAFSARYYSSCLAVEADGSWLLIDCPHPIRKVLCEASISAGIALDLDQITGVALTHLHADHCSGLEGLGFYNRFVLDRRAPLLAHPLVSARLWDAHLAAGMETALQNRGQPPAVRRFEDFFDLVPVGESKAVTFGPFSILSRQTVHTVPTTAFLVRAGERCLGYSADTAFDPDLIDWLAGADLIVHECNPGLLHTLYEDLAGLSEALRAKMRLIHYPDDFDVDQSIIEPLHQGSLYLV
jgi:ribonuclease BN (tRNA processing enzyme)